MTASSALEALLGLALVVFICVRQVRWSPVNTRRMWRAPLILGVIGVYTLVTSIDGTRVTSTDIGFIAIEVVVGIGTGALMGLFSTFRPISEANKVRALARHRPTDISEPPTTESRTGWIGIALWVVVIGVRIAFEVIGRQMHLELAASTGIVFLVIALNRAARTLVFASRLDRHLSLVA